MKIIIHISRDFHKINFKNLELLIARILYVVFIQTTVKDCAARSIGILQEAMRWAPNTTKAHLMDYLLQMENTSRGLYQHTGLSLATESVLNYAGYNRGSSSLGVRESSDALTKY